MAMADYTDKLLKIAKAEIVIGTYPDPSAPDGRGVLVIKEPAFFSTIACGQNPHPLDSVPRLA